ncbi:putative histidine kinase hhk6p [Phaeomoniella chlamydospora]|uniref:Putative histidine kinase hhk6p n=1 Tax=Phaeomoniella chlamydospora TaxID=158046 RepID=A0A0G2E220_PHACM|nr:putative histidine kinase hhk6p [Phaeomoniella chlamydospora]
MQLQSFGKLGSVAFEELKLPCLVVSPRRKVVLANDAARRLFGGKLGNTCKKSWRRFLLGVGIAELPIRIRDSDINFEQTYLRLSDESTFPETCQEGKGAGTNGTTDFWAEEEQRFNTSITVDIIQQPSETAIPALVNLIRVKHGTNSHYLLTFSRPPREAIPEPDCDIDGLANRRGVRRRRDSALSHDGPFPEPLLQPRLSRAYPLRPHDDISGSPRLDARFARLRDAFYYNTSHVFSILMAADLSFAVMQLRGSDRAQPVEIIDIKDFCNRWTIWDEHFTRKLDLLEYPSLRLNNTRKDFKKLRFGRMLGDKKVVIESKGRCLYDPDNNDNYIGGLVTGRELGEYSEVMARDLDSQLASFESICDRMPHIVWTSVSNGLCDYFSKGWYEFTGLSREDSIQQGWQAVLHPDDLSSLLTQWSKYKEAGEDLFTGEGRYRRHDGVYRWMAIRVNPLKLDSGRVPKFYGSLTDIEDAVKMRQEAEAVQKHLLNTLGNASVTLFRVEPSWEVSMVRGQGHMSDDPMEQKRETFRKQWERGNVFDNLAAIHEGGLPSFESKLREAMTGNVEYTTSEDHCFNRVIRTRFMPDFDTSNGVLVVKGVIGCVMDITDIHESAKLESENARLIAHEQVARERSELKSQFLAHGVIGMSDLLAETNLNMSQQDLVDCIQMSARNLLIIVNDILDFSKIEANQMHLESIPFHLASLIHDSVRMFSHSANQKSLEFRCDSEVPEHLIIKGDSGRVRQILTNLVSNAIKFTAEGSVHLSVTLSDDTARIVVKDTGCGMDRETQARLFEPFRQGDSSTARVYGGTGLGLTISQNLAHMMGGQLALQSSVGVGTIATFTMPLVYAQRHEMQRHNSISGIAPQQSDLDFNAAVNVLIVEDNPINQKIALNSVKKLGYQATAVTNGREALQHLSQVQKIDVILMDVQMPVLDGYETTRTLRTHKSFEHLKSIPIIALTASAIKGDNEKCEEAGMDDYLSKPYPLRALGEKLFKWTRRNIDDRNV